MTNESYEHNKRKNELSLLIDSCSDNEIDIVIAELRELAKQKRTK